MRRKKVWVPEGDQISFLAMQTLGLSPSVLPVTDVLTGLQTGLIEITFASPVAALVLQWHTKVKYITDLPVSYSYGHIRDRAGARSALSADDQKVVREVMTRDMSGLDHDGARRQRARRPTCSRSGLKPVTVNADGRRGWRHTIEASLSAAAGAAGHRCGAVRRVARGSRRISQVAPVGVARRLALERRPRTAPGSRVSSGSARSRRLFCRPARRAHRVLDAAQIVLRNVFSIGVTWGDGLARLAVLWLALLGALAASRDGRHITMGALLQRLPPRLQLVAGVCADMFAAVVSAALAYLAFEFVRDSREFGDTLLGHSRPGGSKRSCRSRSR